MKNHTKCTIEMHKEHHAPNCLCATKRLVQLTKLLKTQKLTPIVSITPNATTVTTVEAPAFKATFKITREGVGAL